MCCVIVAVGLFVIPHDVAPRELISHALNAEAENHSNTLYGLLIIIAGLIGAAIGVAAGSKGPGSGDTTIEQ
jgi:hypothetical protein